MIEAVGIQPTIDTAISVTRKGGALTLIGNVAPRVEMALQAIVSRELSLYGVCAANDEYPDCVQLRRLRTHQRRSADQRVCTHRGRPGGV